MKSGNEVPEAEKIIIIIVSMVNYYYANNNNSNSGMALSGSHVYFCSCAFLTLVTQYTEGIV